MSQQTINVGLKWNVPANCWMADVADQNGNAIVNGLALVTGCDLLEQFEYLALGGKMIVQTDGDAMKVPDFASLGTNGHLYYVANPA